MSKFEIVDNFRVTDPLPQPKRDTWLKRTCRKLISRMNTKFKLGRVQYGTDFGEQTVDYLLDQIEQEAIDQLMYVSELKRRRIIEKEKGQTQL